MVANARGDLQKAKTGSANCNPGLEKGLVQILLDHDNDRYRGQNGWRTEGWNLMYQKFCDQFLYVGFSRLQVQDKEKELKREFDMLKDARQQSGVHWDEKLCMIMAEPEIWDNIIASYPKASKFQRNGFPLFDDLYKLHAGKTAEGNNAFISLEVKEDQHTTDQHTTDDDVSILEPSMDQHTTGVGSLSFLSSYNQHDDSDEEVRILHASTSSREKGPATESSFKDKRSVVERNEEPSASGVKGKKAGEKRKNSDIAEMMGSYIELKAKQTQVNVVQQERAREESASFSITASFSIKNCNAVLATIED